MYIRALVDRESAEKKISDKKILFFKLKRKVSKLEIIYLPYYVFKVVISSKKNKKEIEIAVDGIGGNTTMFTSESASISEEAAGESFGFKLTSEEAEQKALHELKWTLYENRVPLKGIYNPETVTDRKQVYFPYWVGYFLEGKNWNFKAIDALAGAPDGMRIRRVLMEAFQLKPSSQMNPGSE